jgi:hypothetical protein
MGRYGWEDPVSENSRRPLVGKLFSWFSRLHDSEPERMWPNARTAMFDYSILYHGLNKFRVEQVSRLGEYDYVVGNSYSVVTALVGWVLWRLCHYQPDSPIAGSCGGGSCT